MTNNGTIPFPSGTSHMSRWQIATLPDLKWHNQSRKELEVFTQGNLMVEASDVVYLYEADEPLLVAGLYRPVLVGIPYLWVLLAEGIERARPSDLRYLHREIGEFAPIQTLIEFDNEPARRLAKVLGLAPQNRFMTMYDTKYEIHGRSGWLS